MFEKVDMQIKAASIFNDQISATVIPDKKTIKRRERERTSCQMQTGPLPYVMPFDQQTLFYRFFDSMPKDM